MPSWAIARRSTSRSGATNANSTMDWPRSSLGWRGGGMAAGLGVERRLGEGDAGGTSADQAPPAKAVLREVARDVADLGVETGLKGDERADAEDGDEREDEPVLGHGLTLMSGE